MARLGLLRERLVVVSRTATEPNATQEPHPPWFFTGVVKFLPPTLRRS